MNINNMDTKDKENTNQLLQCLHQQFSENQNHHSGLFIQILIALFALFGVLGYVAFNTKSFNFINDANYNDIAYCLTTTLVSLVLLLLNKLVLGYGYGFRRDQRINQRIRFKFLGGEDGYKEIFRDQYKADNKGKYSYLPSFHMIFFCAITIGQFMLCLSMLILSIVSDCANRYFIIPLFVATIIIFGISVYLYYVTYLKYIENIKQRDSSN